MLTRCQVESELSLAYLHAIAAKAAFSVDVPHIDSDSVDAIVAAKGKLAPDSIAFSPRIEIQLKSTINAAISSHGMIAHQIPLKNYNDLKAPTVLPRLLVLLALPPLDIDWLVHHPDKLILQKCAYFLNLKGMPDLSGVADPTVHIPAGNMLTPDSLRHLMIKASKYQDL